MYQSNSRELQSYQERFVAGFLQPDAPQYRRLVAPTGSGKTSTVIAIVQRLLAEQPASRILIFVDSVARGQQYLHSLDSWSESIRAAHVDRYLYRELVASAPVGESPWQPGLVTVMAVHLARQQDIARSLAETDWGLVIVDDSRFIGPAKRPRITRLLDAGVVSRLLLVTGVPSESVGAVSTPGVETTTWTSDSLSPERQLAAINLEVVEYQRTQEEIDFLKSVMELAKEAVDTPVGRLIMSVLLHRASSSLAAAEKSIRRQRNRLAHGDFLSAIETDSHVDTDSAVEHDTAGVAGDMLDVWSNPRVAFAKVAKALDALEEIPVDAKLQSLLTLVNRLSIGLPPTRVAVFSSYADTILYLQQSLGELNESPYRVTADLSYEERDRSYREWRERGGVLLLTYGATVGADLRLEHVILYDLPQGSQQMARVSGLFYRCSGGVQLRVYALRDGSEAMPEEGDALQALVELIEAFE